MTPAWDELIRRSVQYLDACQARLRDEFSLMIMTRVRWASDDAARRRA